MTGSSELTHANGLASGPVQAQETLESFPKELKVVSLYLSIISHRSSFNKLVNDVYLFMKDRYFIGEVLEACLEGKSWYNCTILQVRAPTEKEIKDYQDSPVGSADDDPIFPPACLYHYQVEKFCSYNDINRVFEASASHVRRKKRLITKGKLNLFLKQCLIQDSCGIWSVQESVQQNFGIHGVKFSDIFVGQPPQFPKKYEKVAKKVKKDTHPNQNGPNGIVVKKESTKKIKNSTKASREQNSFTSNESSDGDDFKNGCWQVSNVNSTVNQQKLSPGKSLKLDVKHSTKVKKVKKKYGKLENEKQNLDQSGKRKYTTWRGLTWEERQKLKEKKKKRIMMEKLKKSEERLKAKAKREEEKLQMAQVLKDRNKLREDLECEDLKAMPVPCKVNCSYVPNELFGEFMTILEFFQSFQSVIEMKPYFPRGITFNQLESALVDENIDGPFCNIIMLLLSALFKMQDDDDNVDTDIVDFDREELTGVMEATQSARLTAELGSRLYQGAFFSDVTLNHLTVTEVLRLHLVSCGGGRGEIDPNNQRDFAVDPGNPAIMLRTNHPRILRDLSTKHVSELRMNDKLSILCCLVDQVLTCVPVREVLDERGEQLRQAKLEIRAYKAAEVKRIKEAHAQRIKEKKEAKMKLKDKETPQSSNTPEPDVQMKMEVAKMQFEKELRSNERKKSDLEETISKLRSLSMHFNLHPIGKDRAHRRFWVFSSLPGLYVENNPYRIGPCLQQATPRRLASPHRAQGVKSPNRKISPQKSPVKKEDCDFSKRALSERHGATEPVRTEMWFCTSSDGCPVHGQTVPRCRWSYFACKDDVTVLIESLNKRGFRESELRKILVRDEQWVKQLVDQCPFDILNVLKSEQKPKTPSSSRYRYLNCPPGTSVNYMLELVLRERILALEDRITSRCMGSLDVKDQSAWRRAIELGEYDMQCDNLVWGFIDDQSECDEPKTQNNEKSQSTKMSHDQVSHDTDSVCPQNTSETETSHGSLLKKSPVRRESLTGRVLEEKNGENRRSLFSESSFRSQHEIEKKNVEIVAKVIDEHSKTSSIQNLASAILQLAQSVDVSYLINPLIDEEVDEDEKLAQLKRWEISLMASTSFSQLFLHISLLDASIHWSKSVLNTRCALCRRRGDGENMLLCDGCNRGHHLYCLKPKLTKVPEGDWYCMKCKPDLKREPEKKRKSASDGGTKEYEKRPSKSRKIMHEDACNACGLKYNLILCSTCPLAYHTECVIPPLKEAPDAMWTCSECNSGSGGTMEEKENETMGSRRSSRRKSGISDVSLNDTMLQDLLTDIMSQKDSWPFLQPVRKAEAPRYHIIIKKPMDLGTMKYKLNRAQYKNNSEFLADALLIFENCRMYNDSDTEVYKCGSRLSQYFKRKCKELSLNLND